MFFGIQLFAIPWTVENKALSPRCLLYVAQVHVHTVGYARKPCHPLSSHSPLAFSLPTLLSFPMSQLFAFAGQSVEASASASVLPMKIQN